MIHATPIPEVPRLADYPAFVWHSALRQDSLDVLTVSKIAGAISALPEHFLPPTYALEFVVRGEIHGNVNGRHVCLTPNTGVLFLADNVLQKVQMSEDCELYILGFTAQIGEELNLKVPHTQMAQLMMRPTWQMSEQKMAVVLRYFELLRDVVAEGNKQVVMNMVRSLMYYVADEYSVDLKQEHQLTRTEDICGRFLTLVEAHCRRHHDINWYASELCLAPKYLSNVVKKTLQHTAGDCIDEALIRQAKSLLVSTTYSVQQIADRLGFLNQSHFGTFFRRKTGMSPAAFRKA